MESEYLDRCKGFDQFLCTEGARTLTPAEELPLPTDRPTDLEVTAPFSLTLSLGRCNKVGCRDVRGLGNELNAQFRNERPCQ